jgi:hypothetical protein
MVMSTPIMGGLDTPAKQAKADEIRKASRTVRQRINDPDHLEHRKTTNTVQSALLQSTSIVDSEHGTERARLWSDLAGDLNLTAAELTPNQWGSQGEPPLVDLRCRFWLMKRARLFLLCVYIFYFDY